MSYEILLSHFPASILHYATKTVFPKASLAMCLPGLKKKSSLAPHHQKETSKLLSMVQDWSRPPLSPIAQVLYALAVKACRLPHKLSCVSVLMASQCCFLCLESLSSGNHLIWDVLAETYPLSYPPLLFPHPPK